MAACARCGTPAPSDARFCGACGAALGPPAPSPPGFTAPASPGAPKDTRTAQTLLLVGAILSVLLSLAFAALFALFAGFFSAFDGGPFPGFLFATFGLLFAGAGIVLAVVALYARSELMQGNVERGAIAGLIAGVLMFVTGDPLGGVVTVVGGALAWTAK